jgi:diketogulonate reductase-like aldo/keto reductase
VERRRLGRTDIVTSVLGFGGSEIGYQSVSARTVARLLGSALDAGLNVIDTAECYDDSESLIGKALGARRREVSLFTKCGHAGGWSSADWRRAPLLASVERSLRRLATDHVDLIQLHSCSLAELRRSEAIEALERARERGWARYIGYSGDGEAARYAVECGRFDTLQTSVSIADQDAIERTLPLAIARQMGVIAKRPLAARQRRVELREEAVGAVLPDLLVAPPEARLPVPEGGLRRGGGHGLAFHPARAWRAHRDRRDHEAGALAAERGAARGRCPPGRRVRADPRALERGRRRVMGRPGLSRRGARPRSDSTPGETLAGIRSIRCETVAAALALIAVAVLSAVALVDPPLAARLTVENGVVEWIQVLLDAGAALLFGRDLVRTARETGRMSPLDLAIVACLIGLIIGEVDLDRIVSGTKIIAIGFFVNARVALVWRLLAVLVVVGVPVAIGLFVLVRFRAFWRESWAAVGEPWGRVLAVSVALSVVTEVFERELGHVPGVPHLFLEELLELVAAIGFFVAAAARRAR